MSSTDVQLRFRLDAGNYARRNCPASVLLPMPIDPVDMPVLHREGRKRPVNCQLAPTPQGTRLWWITDSLPAGRSQHYTLTTGLRQRQPHARAQTRRTDGGVGLLIEKDVRAAIEFPGKDRRLYQLRLADSVLTARVGALDGETLRRAGRQPLRLGGGPLFSWAVCNSDYARHVQTPLWNEVIRTRLYVVEDFTVVDVQLTWRANCRPVNLPVQAPWPGLALQGFKNAEVTALPGWKGGEDWDGKRSSALIIPEGSRSVAVMVASDSFCFPPTLCADQDGVVMTHASASGSFHLALGEMFSIGFRIIRFEAKDPDAFAVQRYFDFDCPPTATFQD